MEPFEMYFPETMDEACSLLAEHNAKAISGGTALMTLMKERVFQPDSLVNLRGLRTEHEYIERQGNEIHIGALTSLRAIETNAVIRDSVPVIRECLSEVASIRVRNVATIGGNLSHADPDLDLPPVLAGLDAKIVVHSLGGERILDIKEFIKGYYHTDMSENELVKAIRIPIAPDRAAVYEKYRSLSEADWPCVGVAAFLNDAEGVPTVFMNSVTDTPIFRVEGLAEVFEPGMSDAAIETAGALAEEQCDPIGDARGSAWYKRRMANEITQRAIRTVFKRAQGGPVAG